MRFAPAKKRSPVVAFLLSHQRSVLLALILFWLVGFWLVRPLYSRRKRKHDEYRSCKHTVESPEVVCDSKGRMCTWDQMRDDGCCNATEAEPTSRLLCATQCVTVNRGNQRPRRCSTFETCVCCCLKLNRSPWDSCKSNCRTNSDSVKSGRKWVDASHRFCS